MRNEVDLGSPEFSLTRWPILWMRSFALQCTSPCPQRFNTNRGKNIRWNKGGVLAAFLTSSAGYYPTSFPSSSHRTVEGECVAVAASPFSNDRWTCLTFVFSCFLCLHVLFFLLCLGGHDGPFRSVPIFSRC